MALDTMYAGKVNSPATTLDGAINDSVTTINVVDGGDLPDAPNLAVIGTGEDAETILYETKNGNELSDVTRGFQGVAKEWDSGTPVARLFTAYDYDTLKSNITDLESRLGEVNTISNIGEGAEIYSGKDGVDFELRTLKAGSDKIDISWYTDGDYSLEEEQNSGGSEAPIVWGAIWHAQTFTPSTSYNIKRVILRLKHQGSPRGTGLVISIKATDVDGKPTGEDLISKNIGTPTTSSYTDITCTFDKSLPLTAGTKYAIVFQNEDASGNYLIYWEYVNSDSFSGGSYLTSSNSGSTWTEYASRDFRFKVYSIGVSITMKLK